MSDAIDIIVVGAGPAGMAAAIAATRHGARTLVLDEQRKPGGQIYRAVESTKTRKRPELGKSYHAGLNLAEAFRDCDAEYVPQATVWQLSREGELGYSADGAARIVRGRQVILATGAQERPFPVPGWTQAGVMTAGAAQILLKESGIGVENAIFAGTGPLLYLIAHQYLAFGIPIKAFVDLTPGKNYLRALRHLPGALSGIARIAEGWRWKRRIANSDTRYIAGADDIRIIGDGTATGLAYRRNGGWTEISSDHVLLHQGVVPNVNLSMAAGCESRWNEELLCWTIKVDDWFQSSLSNIAVTGDGTSISGAIAAEHSGHIAALGALERLGKLDATARDRLARPHRAVLATERRLRPFLDSLFRPADNFRIPGASDTVVCRCEEITAGTIRDVVEIGCAGPNQLKSFCRCGMGPCQGRFCGLTVSELIADVTGAPISDVGYYRLRPPVKPLHLSELAALELPARE